jgi:hypothetical protein
LFGHGINVCYKTPQHKSIRHSESKGMWHDRHTLGGGTDVQWEDGKIDDAQVVRSVYLYMGFSGASADIFGRTLTFSCGSTTPPLSRGSIEQVPDVSEYAI